MTLLLPALLAAVLAQDAPIPPEEAPRRMTLPAGFRATLFAGEPDVVQPIAFTIDDRGRLWVVECHSYPNWIPPGKEGRDRILIFEDVDGDGRFDARKVFQDRLANVSGIALGFGGAWILAIPNLLFIPDRDGDDAPDGPPEVLLDGWDMKARHNVFSKPMWGPDGWLYACNGINATSRVAKPGTPDTERVSMNCGVWRYHPTRRVFEVVATGTTNPWGLDFDDHGELFISNCVIKHLWHVVPGGHYERMYGQDPTPNHYELMKSPADHIHWAGGPWQGSRGGEAHSKPGGGHAHAGLMIYLGDNWPAEFRGRAFMSNLHGHRINQDTLERRGSGVVARHAPDFLHANDPWFRALDLQYGPDGGVYMTDWTDTGECHDYDVCDATNGRIFKVTCGDVKPARVDLAKLSDDELVKLQFHRNEWFVRHARRLLQERAGAGTLSPGAAGALRGILETEPGVPGRLRALWALHAVGGIDARLTERLLSDREAAVRAWAVRLAFEGDVSVPSAESLRGLPARAAAEESPLVRLALASGLRRLPPRDRLPLARRLVSRAGDAEDPNLPLLLWYGIEPLVAADPEAARELLREARIPLLRQFIARRMAQD